MNEPAPPGRSAPYDNATLDVRRVLSERAARAWLVAHGLAKVVDDLRYRMTDRDPVPTPGLFTLLTRSTELTTEATNVLDAEVIVAEERDHARRRDSDRDSTHVRSSEQLQSVFEAERIARQIAQLTLGVASHGPGTDDVARVERAAVAVLAPSDGVSVRLVDDGIELFATDRDELRVEVAGIIGRLLVDWGGAVRLSTATDVVRLEVQGDTLHVDVHGDSAERLAGRGWAPDGGGGFRRSWSSPVTVLEPCYEVVEFLVETLGIASAAEVTVCIENELTTPTTDEFTARLGFQRPHLR